jgi:regulatory protein
LKGSRDKATQYALKLLSYRGRSVKELQERLRAKGIPESAISSAIGYLKDIGLIDDVSLAESLKREAQATKMLSRKGAKKYLFSRGIPRDIIDSVFSDEENADVDNARRFVNKKMRVLGGYPSEIVKRRLYGLLSRRGYSSETILKVLKDKYCIKEV